MYCLLINKVNSRFLPIIAKYEEPRRGQEDLKIIESMYTCTLCRLSVCCAYSGVCKCIHCMLDQYLLKPFTASCVDGR